MPASPAPPQVAQHRTRREDALPERDGNAGVRVGDHVARGEDAVARRAQLLVDDDGAGSVEVEPTGDELCPRDAGDLHDDADDVEPAPGAIQTAEHDGLEVVDS